MEIVVVDNPVFEDGFPEKNGYTFFPNCFSKKYLFIICSIKHECNVRILHSVIISEK